MSAPKPPATTRPTGKAPAGAASPSVRGHWDGAFTGKRADVAELALTMPLRRSTAGGSGSFLGVGSDGARYWIKPLNNRQCERVCISEQIVGRIGHLIGAPTCGVRTIEIPAVLAGTWEFRDGAKLEAGIAHASLDTPNALETGVLERRKDDDNASRHAYILALYDLCWGDDPQWLMDLGDDSKFYSHDHGLYFPDGPYWTEASLSRCIDAPREHDRANNDDISQVAIATIVDRLRTLNDAEIVAALSAIPTQWPVTDAELEVVGHFILTRAPAVAGRLERRFPRDAK